ncbi:MAG: DUF2059 domain-containing protein [Kiritimatiellae bacterium]|nr:DUF2059 domain-containing protein [Kiritimatiellia bacterium]
MKKLVGCIAAGLVIGMTCAHAQDAAQLATAEELLTVMDVKATIEKSFEIMKQTMPGQMQQAMQAAGETGASADASASMDKMMDLMAVEFGWEKMKADYIRLYAETFTKAEMQDIMAFYKSPAGKAFLAKQPELTKRSMEMTQKVMARVMPKMMALVKESAAKTPAPAAGK